jgi:predicted component of type VI protein secretion system
MPEYLKLPIRFDQFFQKKRLTTCGLRESVARNLHLLITTGVEENKHDLNYGATFWDYDYDIHLSADARRELVSNSIRQQVSSYEKRLTNFSVQVNVKQAEYFINSASQLRRRIEIIISGFLVHSNEPFQFQTAFFIGPMLFD